MQLDDPDASVAADDTDNAPVPGESAVDSVDGEVVGGAPVEESGADAQMVRAVQMLSEHKGPLPSEDWLTTVEQLEPGTTRRLVDDFVAGREHERAIQARAIEIDKENFGRFARYRSSN
jgi:hypothetical protein